MEISRATIDDAEEVLALQRLAFGDQAELYQDHLLPPMVERVEQVRAKFADHIFLKAMESGVIVGSVRACEHDGVCHIGRLVVRPDRRRRGVASALMSAIETEFPAVAQFELFTGTKSEGSIRLYRRLGYEAAGERQVSDKVSHVILVKQRKGATTD
jgi:ribosomal protein S18 acetylase RimI-like enzyme